MISYDDLYVVCHEPYAFTTKRTDGEGLTIPMNSSDISDAIARGAMIQTCPNIAG